MSKICAAGLLDSGKITAAKRMSRFGAYVYPRGKSFFRHL